MWGLGEPQADPQADGRTCEHTCTRVLEQHTRTRSRCAHGLPTTAPLPPPCSLSLCAGPDSSSALAAGCPAPAPQQVCWAGNPGTWQGPSPSELRGSSVGPLHQGTGCPSEPFLLHVPQQESREHGLCTHTCSMEAPSSHTAPARSVGSGPAGLWPRGQHRALAGPAYRGGCAAWSPRAAEPSGWGAGASSPSSWGAVGAGASCLGLQAVLESLLLFHSGSLATPAGRPDNRPAHWHPGAHRGPSVGQEQLLCAGLCPAAPTPLSSSPGRCGQ